MPSISPRKPSTPIMNSKKKPSNSKSPTPQIKRHQHSNSRLNLTPQPGSRSRIHQESKQQKNYNKNKFDSEMELMQRQLKNNINKLCSCLEMYSMLENSLQNQRCLQHNNTLSLYCLNQRRILCVNCLYGMHRHRSHKVVPLKDSMDEVMDDNRKLRTIIEDQIKKMDYYSKMAQQNSIVIQSQMKKVIGEMQAQYRIKIDELKAKFETSKELIIQSFSPVIQKCKQVKSALQDFRFNVWKAFTLYNDQKATDQNQIMKQMLFVKIIELCQFRNRTITKNQLDSMSRRIKQHF